MDGENTTPGSGTSGPEGSPFDFERGYNEIRPEFTRVTQENSQLRDSLSEYEGLFAALRDPDPEVQAQAVAALGFELDNGSQEETHQHDEFVDPLEEAVKSLTERFDRYESTASAEAATREQQRVHDMRDEYIGEAITFIEQQRSEGAEKPFRFSEVEEEVLGNLAIAMTGEDGVPDVQGAYNRLYGTDAFLETNRARWIDTKTAVAPPAGTSVPADRKPQTRAERIAYIDERVAALDRQR